VCRVGPVPTHLDDDDEHPSSVAAGLVNRRIRLSLWAAVLVLCSVFSARHIEFSTDITNFLPDDDAAEAARISRELARSDLARTMVLNIGAKDTATAVEAARRMAAMLRERPEVAWVREGTDEQFLAKAYDLYFPHRFHFLSARPDEELPSLLTDAGLEEQAHRVRASLLLPTAPLVERILPADPLGGFARFTERMQAQEPPLATTDGVFTTRDGAFAVVFLATTRSAFDTIVQRPLLEAIEERFSALRRELGEDLLLEQSGANRFSVDAERSIRSDASMISILSGGGVAVLSYLFFRSMLSLAIVTVPGIAGLVLALFFGLLAFGRLDGMTIGFGASLIGVTIDYPTHLLILWSLSKSGETPWQVSRRLAPSLAMAALTTMASFSGLAMTSLRGFRELGVFAVIGVAGALAATLLLLPDLLPRTRRIQPVSRGLADRLGPWLLGLREKRAALAVVPAAVLVVAAFALPQLRWNDDLSKLSTPNPVLKAEDDRVRARVSNFDAGRLVLAIGDDAEEMLARNEKVHERLSALVQDGKLGGVRSLHSLLWPRAVQERNLEILRSDTTLPARLDAAFVRAGFRSGSFAEFGRALADPPPPLDLETLRASALGPLVSSLVLDLGGRYAALTYLRDVRDPEAVRAAIADIDGVRWFEQRTFLNEVFAGFRDRTLRLVGLGVALVYVLLIVRYRSWRPATAAFLPAVFVPIVVLSCFALAGEETNLMHAVSLLMVMGMGVDYGIFLVDSARDDDAELGATLVSCLICCLTTILSFGTLALSSQPPLRAIGLTTGGGVALALLLAPIALLFLKTDAPRGPSAETSGSNHPHEEMP
jgi:predicted exporter